MKFKELMVGTLYSYNKPHPYNRNIYKKIEEDYVKLVFHHIGGQCPDDLPPRMREKNPYVDVTQIEKYTIIEV